MFKTLKIVLSAGLLTGMFVASSIGLSNNALAIAGCSPASIAGAAALAAKVKALSKTNPAAALAIAQGVAATKSKCFQLAFGAELDGTGTASTGGAASPG
jgi:uncharacterized membrane protein YadS